MTSLCVLGCSGVGKSSLCNLLSGDPTAFQVSDSIDACSQHSITKRCKWLGTGHTVSITDTPGQLLLGGFSKSHGIIQFGGAYKNLGHLNFVNKEAFSSGTDACTESRISSCSSQMADTSCLLWPDQILKCVSVLKHVVHNKTKSGEKCLNQVMGPLRTQ